MTDPSPTPPGLDVALGVTRVSTAALSVDGDMWPYARRNAQAIDAHWREATATNPRYFNGVVHLTQRARIIDDRLEASLVQTDFKSYLFWRTCGFPEAGMLDGFGSGLIRTADGDIMLGRQRRGNVNAGLVYLPAGFIDQSDVDARGRIDITQAVRREIIEETGVESGKLTTEAGCLVARSGAQLSIVVPFRVASGTAAFMASVASHLAKAEDSELEAVIAVSNRAEIESLPLPAYTRVLLEAVLA